MLHFKHSVGSIETLIQSYDIAKFVQVNHTQFSCLINLNFINKQDRRYSDPKARNG